MAKSTEKDCTKKGHLQGHDATAPEDWLTLSMSGPPLALPPDTSSPTGKSETAGPGDSLLPLT